MCLRIFYQGKNTNAIQMVADQTHGYMVTISVAGLQKYNTGCYVIKKSLISGKGLLMYSMRLEEGTVLVSVMV